MMKKIYYLIALITLTTYSCSTNSPDDLLEPAEVIELVTYNDNIKSIIDANCIVCHSDPPVNGAPMPLVSFDNVRSSAQNNLLARISLQTGEAGAMPLGGVRLPQQSIDLVAQWISDGLLEE